MNTQPWYFITIKDKNDIEQIFEEAAYGAFHTEPSVVVAIVLDVSVCSKEIHRGMKKGKLGLYEGYLSLGMPVMNMVLAAESLGVNSCIVTPQENIKKILALRKGDTVPVILGFGYEAKGAFQKKRVRKSLRDISFSKGGKEGD